MPESWGGSHRCNKKVDEKKTGLGRKISFFRAAGQEMEQGKLRSRGGLFFLPEGEGLPKLYTRREMEKHRAVYLPPYALRWWADYPAAQICRSCSKIVVDYN